MKFELNYRARAPSLRLIVVGGHLLSARPSVATVAGPARPSRSARPRRRRRRRQQVAELASVRFRHQAHLRKSLEAPLATCRCRPARRFPFRAAAQFRSRPMRMQMAPARGRPQTRPPAGSRPDRSGRRFRHFHRSEWAPASPIKEASRSTGRRRPLSGGCQWPPAGHFRRHRRRPGA